MDPAAARRMARETFVTDDNSYGCAETSYVVLKHVFELPDPADSGPAMALNGGVAYQGGMCGAITGAALAVGELSARRVPEHSTAKTVARGMVRSVIEEFAEEFGSLECRELTGYELHRPGEHDRFIEAGIWRTTCAAQVEHCVGRLAELASPEVWDREIARLEVME